MSDYPGLYDLHAGHLVSLPKDDVRAVFGRAPDAFFVLRDPGASRVQFAITKSQGGYRLEGLSDKVPTRIGEEVVAEPRLLRHGDLVACSETRFRVLLEADAAALTDGDHPAPARTVPPPAVRPGGILTILGDEGSPGSFEIEGEFPLGRSTIIGRERGKVQILLDHPNVSRVHAQIAAGREGYLISDLSSANGTFVNGTRIRSAVVIKPGDRIDVGPCRLEFTGTSLVPSTLDGNVRLLGKGLVREVGPTNGRRRILQEVDVVIEPCEFTCIIGPSGSGKSTLMNALSARTPADQGKVMVNRLDLYANFELLKQTIAFVPQRDLLPATLTVQDALSYTARLRLPPDTTEGDVQTAVQAAATAAKIDDRRRVRIGDLSGGQLKRASLANEIICRPSLLFLDEVTSGLDEQTDRDMMALFREMAEGGMTVVCVTHSLANVEEYCHRIVVLAEGGWLAFVGTPEEALSFFGVQRLGDIYEVLSRRAGEEWRDAFRPVATKALAAALTEVEQETTRIPRVYRRPIDQVVGEAARQLGILVRRNLALLLADRRNLGIALGQAVLIGLLLALVFPTTEFTDQSRLAASDTTMLFLLAVTSLWMGCNNAAKDIVKERELYRRERDVNLSIPAFVAAKAVVLGALGLVQVVAFFLVVIVFTDVPETDSFVFPQLLLAVLIGTNLGLVVSAFARTLDQAATLVPLVLIPQIVLSGALKPLEGFAEFLAEAAVSAHWVFMGLAAGLPSGLRASAGLGNPSGMAALAMQFLHLSVFFVGAIATLLFQEVRNREVYGKAARQWLLDARQRITAATDARKARA